jgi:hypothetical protein
MAEREDDGVPSSLSLGIDARCCIDMFEPIGVNLGSTMTNGFNLVSSFPSLNIL